MVYVVLRIRKHMHGIQQVTEVIRFVREEQHREQQLSQQYEEQEHGSVLVLSEVQQ